MSSGDSDAADRQIQLQQEEEARKVALRKRVGFLFGEGPETERKQIGVKPGTGPRRFFPDALPEPVFGKPTPTPVRAAREQFGREETDLTTALRGEYEDTLKKDYGRAERAVRFGAANTGNTGGSVAADAFTELEEGNRMGGTRIADAVQRAINGLRASREESKMRSFSLINAGAGEEGVRSAQSGIRSALDNARAGTRENLTSDLFGDIALAKRGGDARDRDAALLAFFAGRNRGLGGAGSTSSGRVIDTGGV